MEGSGYPWGRPWQASGPHRPHDRAYPRFAENPSPQGPAGFHSARRGGGWDDGRPSHGRGSGGRRGGGGGHHRAQGSEDGCDQDRPPPGLRGRALGLWYRDRSLRLGRGGKPREAPTLSMHVESEDRIKQLLDRAGRPPQSVAAAEAASAASSGRRALPGRDVAASSAATHWEPEQAALPTVFDVCGEDGVEGDPHICVNEGREWSEDESEEVKPAADVAKTASADDSEMVETSGRSPLRDRLPEAEKWGSDGPLDEGVKVKQTRQSGEIDDTCAVRTNQETPDWFECTDTVHAPESLENSTTQPHKLHGPDSANMTSSASVSSSGAASSRTSDVPEQPGAASSRTSDVPEQPGAASSRTSDVPEQPGAASSRTSDVPEQPGAASSGTSDVPEQPGAASSRTSDVPEEQFVAGLDPGLAEKYRHLTNSSFKHEFLANLIGNQDRDWDNLSYDPAVDGLQREPAVDDQLLQQSGAAGPLDAFRQALPAWQQRQHILGLVANNQVVVISGETGCGKTTQVCQYLLEEAAARGDGSLCHVVCTQPRRISAVSVAERVARERGQRLSADGGGQVGYAIRLDHRQPRRNGSLLFCTTGVLLQRLQSDPVLARVSHLVIDEVHERDSLTDFLVTIVKGLLPTRSDLKVVLMSATINSAEFSAYFDHCPMVHIPGRAYPVDGLYLEEVLQLTRFRFEPGGGSGGGGRGRRRPAFDEADRVAEHQRVHMPYVRQLESQQPAPYDSAVLSQLLQPESENFTPELYASLVRHICLNEPEEGAILVFVSGWDEISKVHRALREDSVLCDERRFLILPLHSMMPTVEQREVFERPPPGTRKVIVATNIAETSITIDDVVYVVDGGKIKMKNVDKKTGCMTLKPEWVSKANSRQRRGRAGRVQPGKCFHLYSRAREACLADYPVPEILRTGLEELCLQVKILRLGRVAPFLARAMDQPSADAVQRAIQLLRCLRALDEREHLTPLGFHLARLPMDPQTGKMLLMAAIFSCLDPVLTVASCLSFKEPFVIPLGKESAADLARQRLSGGLLSDHLTMVHAFKQWTTARNRSAFAREFFLSSSTLEMIKSLRLQFLEQLQKLRFVRARDPLHPSLNVNSDNMGVVRAVITAGLYPNVLHARRTKHGRIICSSPEGRCNLHPKSVVNGADSLPAPWMVYKLKIKSASVMVHDCSLVSPYQLLLFGQQLVISQDQQEPAAAPHISVDPFVRFKCPRTTAELMQGLRAELDSIVLKRLTDPRQTDWDRSCHETDVLRLIVELVSSDSLCSEVPSPGQPARSEWGPWRSAGAAGRPRAVDGDWRRRRAEDRNGCGSGASGRHGLSRGRWDGAPGAARHWNVNYR